MKDETKSTIGTMFRSDRDPASFRDPAATVYTTDGLTEGEITRFIHPCYFSDYTEFMEKVYGDLINEHLIIPHREVYQDSHYIIIKPEKIPFISYPYEWSFSMLKEAALNTLRINEIALKHGMILKDATAYNMQYYQGRMTLIDTTSFMKYSGDTFWLPYSQFIRHFANPLLLMKYCGPSMVRMSQLHIDGIPTDLTKKLIPFFKRFSPRVLIHILPLSYAEGSTRETKRKVHVSPVKQASLLKSLYKFINSLERKPKSQGRSWLGYTDHGDSYTSEGFKNKVSIVTKLIRSGETILDIGSNTGMYSYIAMEKGCRVIAIDNDHDCIDYHCRIRKPYHLEPLPLYVDICNPSSGIGWAGSERYSFWDRIGKVDTILALALIHHLSIRNNIPLGMVADLMADHCKRLIIEWVPLKDKQARTLLGNKEIPEYNHNVFLREFGRRFKRITKVGQVSERIIYEMEVK